MRRSPSLDSLRLFLRVAHTQSFTETARTSHVSQPALSRTIRLLEEELGTRLFDRTSRHVGLTVAGEALLPTVERLIADFDHAFVELEQSFAGHRGRIVIGALPSVAANALAPLIAEFQSHHPLVEIVLQDSISGSLYQQMQERQIDLAITTPPEILGFEFVPLLNDECVLVGLAEQLGGSSASAPWSIFTERPFIAMAPRSSVRLLTDTAFMKADLTVKPLYECTQLATVGALIDSGLGISALPLSTVPMLNAKQIIWRRLSEPKMERTIGVAWLSQRSLPPAAALFRTLLVSKICPSSIHIAD